MAITVSVLSGGTNSHQTTSEEVNFVRTDLMSVGAIGALTNTSGVAPSTGSFAANAQGTPDMTVAVSSGQCVVTGTPTGGNSQKFRVSNSASSNVTISANATGGTRYDWLYVKVDPDALANPNSGATDVASLVTSRSTSASTDNGTPPTYGTLIAVITVANGASSITNGNIADKRVRSVAVGGVNDDNGNEIMKISSTASAVNEVTFTNAATGNAPSVAATGDDSNISLNLQSKGSTGAIKLTVNSVDQLGAWQTWVPTFANFTKGSATVTAKYQQLGKFVFFTLDVVLSSSTMSTAPTFSLPVTAARSGWPVADAYALDSGTTRYWLNALATNTTTIGLFVQGSGSTYTDQGNVTSSAPMTWANNDEFHVVGFYEAA